MTVDEAMQGVLDAGYCSTSPDFRRIVDIITLSRAGEFERVARDRYRLK